MTRQTRFLWISSFMNDLNPIEQYQQQDMRDMNCRESGYVDTETKDCAGCEVSDLTRETKFLPAKTIEVSSHQIIFSTVVDHRPSTVDPRRPPSSLLSILCAIYVLQVGVSAAHCLR